MVDWDLAITTGTWLVRPGPRHLPRRRPRSVADLRRYAEQAQGHVRDYTGLVADTDGPRSPSSTGRRGSGPTPRDSAPSSNRSSTSCRSAARARLP